ncbi:MAG: CPBP family intramembrane glutamic endopeptidase [Candidatus Cybelea sp.]
MRLVIIAAGCAAILTIALAAEGGRHSIWISIVVTSIVVTLLVGLIALVERMTTGRSLASIGFDPRNAGRDIMLGLGLGTLMFSVVILVLALGGHYHVSAMHLTRDLGIAVLFFASGAAFEELLFRGVLFRLIEEWAGTCIALALSALAFGAAHAFNPGATWVSTLAIALEAGVLLGSAFVVTRNLWFPIGVHFAWNFLEGPICGTQVSGHVFLASLVTAHVTDRPRVADGRRIRPGTWRSRNRDEPHHVDSPPRLRIPQHTNSAFPPEAARRPPIMSEMPC